jgi:hypothetical protein
VCGNDQFGQREKGVGCEGYQGQTMKAYKDHKMENEFTAYLAQMQKNSGGKKQLLKKLKKQIADHKAKQQVDT